MSTAAVRGKGLNVIWEELFNRYLGKYLLVLLTVIPISGLIVVEIQSRAHLETCMSELQIELRQALITSDSYMALRTLKTLENSLQLRWAKLSFNNNELAHIGIAAPNAFRFLYWHVERPILTENGLEVGYIHIQSILFPIQRAIALTFLIFSIAVLLLLLFLIRKYQRAASPVVAEISTITSSLNAAIDGRETGTIQQSIFQTETASSLARAMHRFLAIQKTLVQQNFTLQSQEVLSSLARQVAHDIRSPLTTFNIILRNQNNLSEEERRLALLAVHRINDVAKDLLGRYKESEQIIAPSNIPQETTQVNTIQTPQLLCTILEEIFLEKKYQNRSNLGLTIEMQRLPPTSGFANVPGVELKRIVSNLLDNAVESLPKSIGRISISFESLNVDFWQIVIADDGIGIPKDIVALLGKKGASYGKKNGSGLGIFHAKASLESWGGRLDIESQEGKGTKVILVVPKTGELS